METCDLIYLIFPAILALAVLRCAYIAFPKGYCEFSCLNHIEDQIFTEHMDNKRGAYCSVVLTGEFLLQKW
jgi:hypothetical protein